MIMRPDNLEDDEMMNKLLMMRIESRKYSTISKM